MKPHRIFWTIVVMAIMIVPLIGGSPTAVTIDNSTGKVLNTLPSPLVIHLQTGQTLVIDMGATIMNSGTATGFGGTYLAGTGLTLTGSTFSLALPTTTNQGGVLASTAPTNDFLTGLGTNGILTYAQPNVTGLGGLGTGILAPLQLAPNVADGFVVSDTNNSLHVGNVYTPGLFNPTGPTG